MIEIIDLSKTYHHGQKITHALRDVTLSVEKKDVFGIIGLSGAGKSTLIRCASGLVKPSSGKVLVSNVDIHHLTGKAQRHFRSKIGYVFQHFNLLSSRDVAGNIAYPLEIAGAPKKEQTRRIDELLQLVGLSSKKEMYPAHLSGGEKQRVGIARALANHPELLFCDEATSALDPKTSNEILDLLKKINERLGVTILLITHDMNVIKKICNKVAVIEEGSIVEKGSVSDVFAEPLHPTTKQFIQGSFHEIPQEFLKAPSPNRKLIRLRFKGASASEPVISHLVKTYHVEANILLGWIDRLRETTIGTLVVEFNGSAEAISNALAYLTQKNIPYEQVQ